MNGESIAAPAPCANTIVRAASPRPSNIIRCCFTRRTRGRLACGYFGFIDSFRAPSAIYSVADGITTDERWLSAQQRQWPVGRSIRRQRALFQRLLPSPDYVVVAAPAAANRHRVRGREFALRRWLL